MHGKIQRCAVKFSELWPWVVGAFAVLSANWAADALSQSLEVLLHGTRAFFAPLRAFYITFFALMVVLLYRQRKAFFRPRTRYLSNEPAEKRKHLVLFLSNLPDNEKATGGVPEPLQLSDDIDADLIRLQTLKEHPSRLRWRWEMPLRAIRHHVDTANGTILGPLENVTVICSTESLPQAPWFLNICSRYQLFRQVNFHLLAKRNGRTEHLATLPSEWENTLQGYDFESFDQLSHAVWMLLNKLKKDRVKEDEIMIDITGGQKPTSIVGASLTFNREIRAQYVQTNHPWKVLSYDVILAFSDTGKLDI